MAGRPLTSVPTHVGEQEGGPGGVEGAFQPPHVLRPSCEGGGGVVGGGASVHVQRPGVRATLGLPTPKGRREPGRWLHALCPPPSAVLEELGPGTRQSTPEREGAWGTPAAGVGRDETIGATPRRTEAASRAWQRAPRPPRRWPRAMGAESGPGP